LTLSASTIVLFVCSRDNHAAASWVFADATNGTGWPSDGFAFILSVSNAVYAFLGNDCGAHMCEEIPKPWQERSESHQVPSHGAAYGVSFACACMFAIVDLNSVINTATGLPLIEIYYQGTGQELLPQS
jgi:choline transport protein